MSVFDRDPRARRRIAVHVTDVVAKCRVGVVNECVFEPAGGTVNFHRGMSAVFLEFPCAAADEAQLGIGIESAGLDPAAQKKILARNPKTGQSIEGAIIASYRASARRGLVELRARCG